MKRKASYPTKTSMNLFYKPDRTTKPSTIALYVLFTVAVFLGLAKFLVYDLLMEKLAAQQALEAAQDQLNSVMLQLTDYNEVQERYFRYSATDEEREIVDRLEVLAMLEEVAGKAGLRTINISGMTVTTQLTDVTLTQVAEIVNRLEESPIVASTVVHTAATSSGQVVTNWWGEPLSTGDWDLVQANITIQLQKEEAAEE